MFAGLAKARIFFLVSPPLIQPFPQNRGDRVAERPIFLIRKFPELVHRRVI
jgi:hypothetical protein